MNSKQDDFLQFLPAQFEVTKEEIQAWFVTEDSQKEIRKVMRLFPQKMFSYDLINFKLVVITPPKYEPGQTLPGAVAENEGEIPPVLTAESPECLATVEEILTFEVKKVLDWTTKPGTNSVTGLATEVQDKLEIES